MIQAGNDPLQSKLKKYESILVISGLGVIAFGLWSIIRAGIYYFLYPLEITDYLEQADIDEMMDAGREAGINLDTDIMATGLTVLLFVVMAIDLLLRVYVGLSARAYGRGRRRRGFYIVIVWIMVIFMLITIGSTVDEYAESIIRVLEADDPTEVEQTAKRGDQAASVSFLVDITSLLVLFELGVCSVIVKRLRKKLGIIPDKKWRKNKKEVQELTDEMSQQLRDGLSSIMGE